MRTPSKGKGILFWLAMAFVCMGFMAVVSSKIEKEQQQAASATSPTSQQQESEQITIPEAWKQKPTPEQEKESAAALKRMAKKAPSVQVELKTLYAELQAMRGTKNFVELGFSGKNTTSVEWKKRVESLRECITKDDDLPVIVKVVPSYLLTIGFDKQWRVGKDTADSQSDTKVILDGINWKLEE